MDFTKASLRRGLRVLLTLPIRIYRLVISPALPRTCIYYPSCSHYAQNAIMHHGFIRGIVLGAARIGRCNARFRGGVDYVPSVFRFKRIRWQYRFFSHRAHARHKERNAPGTREG